MEGVDTEGRSPDDEEDDDNVNTPDHVAPRIHSPAASDATQQLREEVVDESITRDRNSASVGPQSAQDPSAQDQPAGEQGAQEQPAQEQPTQDQSAQDQPAQDQPAQDETTQTPETPQDGRERSASPIHPAGTGPELGANHGSLPASQTSSATTTQDNQAVPDDTRDTRATSMSSNSGTKLAAPDPAHNSKGKRPCFANHLTADLDNNGQITDSDTGPATQNGIKQEQNEMPQQLDSNSTVKEKNADDLREELQDIRMMREQLRLEQKETQLKRQLRDKLREQGNAAAPISIEPEL